MLDSPLRVQKPPFLQGTCSTGPVNVGSVGEGGKNESLSCDFFFSSVFVLELDVSPLLLAVPSDVSSGKDPCSSWMSWCGEVIISGWVSCHKGMSPHGAVARLMGHREPGPWLVDS